MKKFLLMGVLIISMGVLTGCSKGISQEEYDKVNNEVTDLKNKNSDLEQNIKTLTSEKNELESKNKEQQAEYEKLNTEYTDYKEKMKPLEELSEAEAEARKIEAEQIKEKAEQEKKEKAEQKKKEKKEKEEAEKKKKEAEEAKGYETGITYDQLARTPDDYEGKKVKFTGKVIQVMEGDYSVQIRLAIDDDYNKIIFGEYVSSIVSSRVLEDDTITIYGLSKGLISYESTMGGKITIPSVYIEKIDQ